MKNLSRRITALLSTMVMAMAFLVTGSTGVASAQDESPVPVSATYVVPQSGAASQFTITRTVSDGTPTYGDVVTVTTHIRRDNLGYLLYEARDYTPACMEYVAGSASANKGGNIEVNTERVQWSYGFGRQADPFTLTANYRITCTPGQVATGGTWMKRALLGDAELGDQNMGPTINVQQVQSSIDLSATPVTVQVNQQFSLSAATTNIADGQTIDFRANGTSIGTGTVQSNVATLSRSFATPGSYAVTAHYGGTTIVSSSASNTTTVTVNKSPSTVSLSAPSPAVAESQVPLTATTSGIADGQPVDFYVNGAKVGSAPASGGTATFGGWIPATPGDYTVQARYAGSATVNASESAQTMVTVIAPVQVTSTSLVVDPDPVPGQTSTLTATVPDGRDGDTVEFSNNGTVLGTRTLNGGVATYDWQVGAALANQPYSLTAHYRGSAGYLESTSTPVTGTVGLVQTTITDVTAPATAEVASAVQLSATIAGGTAGRTVEFRNAGGDVLCSVTLSSGGTATCFWTPTAVGDVEVTAHYPGSGTTAPASSQNATTIAVGKKASSLDLTAPATAAPGQQLALSVTTTGIADGETVTFEVDGASVGTSHVTGGQASVTWTPTTVGTYTATASYAGSETVSAAQSDPSDIVVSLGQTQTSVVSASANPVTGEPMTLSASVTGGTEGVTVEFRNAGGDVLCSDAVDATGAASCSWTPTAVGDVQVTAHYPGDATTASSQSPSATTVSVGQGVVAAPSDLVFSPAAPSTADAVTVSGTAPVGSTVRITGPNGVCETTADGAGAFSCDLGQLPYGAHTLSAVATLNAVDSTAATASVTVSQGTVAPVTGLSVSPSAPTSDQAVSVSGTAAPGASVTVSGPGGSSCTAAADPETGAFSCSLGTLPVGADQTISVTQTVNGVTSEPATVAVSVGQGAVAAPSDLVFSPATPTSDEVVTVSGSAPEGSSVAVSVDGTVVCAAAVVTDGGFSCALGELGVGAHEVSAVATLNGVDSAAATASVTVSQGTVAPVTGLSVSPSAPTSDQAVSVSGTASPGASVTVSGPGGSSCTAAADPETGAFSCSLGTLPVGADQTISVTQTVNGVTSEPATVAVSVGEGAVAAPTVSMTPETPSTDSQVVVSGTAPTGSTVTVSVDGDTVCADVAVAEDGSYTCMVGRLPVGEHEVSAVATLNGVDSAAATASVTVSQGTVAPVTGLTVSPSAPTSDQSVSVSGTAAPGALVTVSGPGGASCTATADAQGVFSCSLGVLPVGADQSVSVTQTVNGVTSAPATTSVSVGQGAVAAPSDLEFSPATPTSDEVVTVSGSAPEGSTVAVSVDGRVVCEAAAVTGGGFSCALGTLGVGAHDVSAVATLNSVPSTAATASVTVSQGTVAPVTGLSVSPSAPTSDQPVTVSGTAAPGASVTVSGPGGASCTAAADSETGAFSCSLGTLPVGADQTISVTQTVNGVTSAPATTSVSVGQGTVAAPSSFTFSPGEPSTTDVVTVSGSAPAGSTVKITGPNGVCETTADDNGAFSCGLGQLPYGTHTLSAVATLNGVQSEAATPAVTVGQAAVDAPSGLSISPSAPTTDQSVTLTGTAPAGSTVAVSVDGTVVCENAPVVDGAFTCALGTFALGGHTVSAVATLNGVASPAGTADFTVGQGAVDTVEGLTVSPSNPTSAQPVTVSGTAAPGATVTVTGPGDAACTATADGQGAFTCSLGVLQAGADQQISVTQTVNGVTSEPVTTTVSVSQAVVVPPAPTGVTVSPSTVEPGATVTVTGTAAPGSTITVTIDGIDQECAPATVAENGSFSCTFDAPAAEGSHTVSVTASNSAGTSTATTATLTVEKEDVPVPTDPSVTLTPNPPVAGQPTTIEVEGQDGEEVVITIGGEEICRETIVNGTATCTWTPGAAGETEIEIVVGTNDPIIETVTVRPADTGSIGSGSLGSLESLFSGSLGSSGS